ncbi:adenylosuccinate synthase [Paenibacillus sacheonensis]|uniref:Adenylosuccinate synthetase n=1 Tax=Paenibacillus sacheonensis TaxID=742054 RepID=A0A7X5C2A1_9BACL|nr:adenylosuccinate synthase [Paenibacillus sacheonensis]MBM7563636.1 adenylosuccinate synthase [Paenibacillus sacheonensis]NBC71070.1 adenylosuccinate synthase [Paenibacillus sacheonensis]
MSVTAIVGANWGDEGKGKVTDALAAKASYVVRFQGGSNAGHTILNEHGKFALRLLPSGVFYPHVTNVVGPGTALDVDMFFGELEGLAGRGVPAPAVIVSDRTQIVMPYHRLFDRLEEERLGGAGFGSTKCGIAPFYADKYAKLGVQASDLYDVRRLRSRLEQSLAAKNILLQHLYGLDPLAVDDLLPALMEYGAKLKPYIADTTAILAEANAQGAPILAEGQLGALRDPDHGIYPFSTSSSPLAGFASVGAGLAPGSITDIVAVTKAYSSCVGAGPFVTELEGAEAEELRSRGGDAGEYGVNTGRPRRVGWLDLVATRYGCRAQGASSVTLTNLDVLGYLDAIPVCIGYRLPNGTMTEDFPVTSLLELAQPVFGELPGWQSDITGCRAFESLPQEAQNYVMFIERRIGVPITRISVGPRREQLIERSGGCL